ncbi:MAG TPA: ribonuclease Y [Myxococcota bacterium]|nr:ribonuclease Y [Myxococcota bacterium]
MAGFGAFLAGAGLAALALGLRLRLRRGGVRAMTEALLQEAEAERARVLRHAEVTAKDILLRTQEAHEQETQAQRDALAAQEKQLRQRETNIERKSEALERRERDLKRRETALETAEGQTRRSLEAAQRESARATEELERIAKLSREEARQQLSDAMQGRARRDAAAQIKRIEAEARAEADEASRRVIATAIQRFAGEFVSEKTVSVVELPSDDMKGRIIGREGRNIRAIEAATGVDVIIDDTPEVVILSAFNPVRREVAKLALERLIADGRIHPARIEEVVERAVSDVDHLILRAGEQATFDLSLHGLHPELVKLVGKLKYRTVNGQNLWSHAVETAAIAAMMASEIGANAVLAKRAGLLHDIGKAVDHEVEGDHAQISADLARRFGEKPPVVEAIAAHRDADPRTVLGVLLQAADTLSKARPGARRDLLDSYVKRLEDLERISLGFQGVDRAYAIQAGREIRVMVDYAKVSDDEAFVLSHDIARRIQDELTYPGEVRVTVIREARATDIAR